MIYVRKKVSWFCVRVEKSCEKSCETDAATNPVAVAFEALFSAPNSELHARVRKPGENQIAANLAHGIDIQAENAIDLVRFRDRP